MIKRLCIFTVDYAFNRQSIINYLEKIIPENIEIYIFTTENNKNKYTSKKAKTADTYCNKYNCFFELRKFCKKNKIDRIINLGVLPQEGFLMLFATIFTKTDFISYQLGNPLEAFKVNEGKRKIKTLFEKLFFYPILFFSKKGVLCLKNLTNHYKRKLPPIKKKIFYFPHLIDISLFIPKNKLNCRKRLKIGKKDKVIIFVGRIEYLKGSDILYETIKQNPDKKFILIGKIKDETYKKRKLKNIIHLESKSQKELVDYYNVADLCFFPSRLEGIPVVPREAMACGIPTIISDISCSKEIKSIIIVPLDIEKMNYEINNFFKLSSREKKELSIKSRNSIIRDYSLETWKEEYIRKILN